VILFDFLRIRNPEPTLPRTQSCKTSLMLMHRVMTEAVNSNTNSHERTTIAFVRIAGGIIKASQLSVFVHVLRGGWARREDGGCERSRSRMKNAAPGAGVRVPAHLHRTCRAKEFCKRADRGFG